MTPEQLDQIIEAAPEVIANLLGDLRSKIVEAAKATLEETQDSETGKANLKVGMSLTIDLACSPVAWQCDASVGVRHKVKSDSEVTDDPQNAELSPGFGKGRRKE